MNIFTLVVGILLSTASFAQSPITQVPSAQPVVQINSVTLQEAPNGEYSVIANVSYQGGCIGTPSFFTTKTFSTSLPLKTDYMLYIAYPNRPAHPCDAMTTVTEDLNLGTMTKSVITVNGTTGAVSSAPVPATENPYSCW